MPQNDELDRIIGDRIRAARNHRDMNLSALAAELGLTYQQVHKYETGRNRISASMLYKVADVLNVELSFLFSGCDAVVKKTKVYAPPPGEEGDTLHAAIQRVRDDDVRKKLAALVAALEGISGAEKGR